MNKQLPFTLGVLTWGSPKTLSNTLRSYEESGLLSLTDDVILFAQEYTQTDLDIAQEFGITNIICSSVNVGIGKAFATITENAKYQNVLVCENDWVALGGKDYIRQQIEYSIYFLVTGEADGCRLRHKYEPGDPLYTRQYIGKEHTLPTHIGDAHHWTTYPDITFPGIFKKITSDDEPAFYQISSKHCCFTNNPVMYRRDFYLDYVSKFDNGGISLEGRIQQDWEQKDFKVVVGDGIFSHYRIDR